MRAYHEKKCFRVIIVIPLLPGFQVCNSWITALAFGKWILYYVLPELCFFQGGIDDGGAASVRAIMHWQYRTICRGQNSIMYNLCDLLGSKAHDYISFYGLRAYGTLSNGGPVATSQVLLHFEAQSDVNWCYQFPVLEKS